MIAQADTARPVLLDLFCGAGGAAMGYHRAGFDIVGVDIAPQPRYPFPFIQANALNFLRILRYHIYGYNAVHASPPCQAYSSLKGLTRREYPALLDEIRSHFLASGLPWVIENVIGAPIHHGIKLCGTMFGLRTYRHRWFESSHLIFSPAHPRHTVPANAHRWRGLSRRDSFLAGNFASITGNCGSYPGREAMGIDWMIGRELSQAVPPAYTEWVGRQLLEVVRHG